jgi:anti-sigma regulatory factor (Ser/Thr protein kinase)
VKTGATLLGCLTIPGRAECVSAARKFTAETLGDDCPYADTAVLLTCELVTNSLQHSNSSRDGGTITITLISVPGGIRAEVIDEGGSTVPTVRSGENTSPDMTEGGRGLQLVNMLSASWSYWSDDAGTVTWFELTEHSP